MNLTLKRLADGAAIAGLVGLGLAPLIPVFNLAAVLVPAAGGLVAGAIVATVCAWRCGLRGGSGRPRASWWTGASRDARGRF
jgi:hypothetical protein